MVGALESGNYANMMPSYLAEMKALGKTDPESNDEFQDGIWIVNNNATSPFCAFGRDHTLEHINHSMKVSGVCLE